jgi:hypothetical protein
MAADFFGDLEPRCRPLLPLPPPLREKIDKICLFLFSACKHCCRKRGAAVVRRKQSLAVLRCPRMLRPRRRRLTSATGSCNSVVGANCTAAAGEGLQADASVAEASDVCERTIVSGWKKRYPLPPTVVS